MEKKFALIHTVATAGVFSAVSFWYGFTFGRESARKELGDLIEDLRRSNSNSAPPPQFVLHKSLAESLWFLPPSDMLFTNSTKCRQFSPSNNFLFIRKYVNALNPLPECDLLVARTCPYALVSYLSNAFSPASSIPVFWVAIFTCCTSPSGEQFACCGCSPSFISIHVKLNMTPYLANILAIGRGPSFSTNPHQASTMTPSTPALFSAIRLAFIARGLFKFPLADIVSNGSITNTGTLVSFV
ncbi:hypothetical protein Cgig2_019860 [Carnegiea gigantea]|uniref:Uncharacterized protein n=1 Tax=Carnegiea gigantea TaxID=171969 RepID=A0A9Q1KKE3_9CARY|nr:hypothetical protein Cgig2_019860 [Carnegiea gigantea]